MKFAALLFLAYPAIASTITSGRIEAGWGFQGEGGISIGLSGDGVSVGAQIDHHTSAFLIDCATCFINVATVAGGPSRGHAAIGDLTSDVFSLSFSTGGDDNWTGTLSLFTGVDTLFHDPFASVDLIGFSIPTMPTWFIPNALGVRDFIFTDPNATAGGGAVAIDAPEPSGFLPMLLLLLYRYRACRQGCSARRLVHPRQ